MELKWIDNNSIGYLWLPLIIDIVLPRFKCTLLIALWHHHLICCSFVFFFNCIIKRLKYSLIWDIMVDGSTDKFISKALIVHLWYLHKSDLKVISWVMQNTKWSTNWRPNPKRTKPHARPRTARHIFSSTFSKMVNLEIFSNFDLFKIWNSK